MRPYFATFYRHRRLYLSALLLAAIASIGGGYYYATTRFEAQARVWVDRPVLADTLDQSTPTFGPTAPPSQQEADKLYQLIQTDSFLLQVVQQTSAAAQLTGVPDRDQEILSRIRKKISVGSLGPNTIHIAYSASDAVSAQQIVQGVLDTYRSWSLQMQVEQGAVEQQFFQKQSDIYHERVSQAMQALDGFYARYPNPSPDSPQYLELQRLQRELESAHGLEAASNMRIAQADLFGTLTGKNQRVEFQVLDKPTVPTEASGTLTNAGKYAAGGIAASLGLLLVVVVLATWQDTVFRTAEDLERLSRVPVLVTVPVLDPIQLPTVLARRGVSPHLPGEPDVGSRLLMIDSRSRGQELVAGA